MLALLLDSVLLRPVPIGVYVHFLHQQFIHNRYGRAVLFVLDVAGQLPLVRQCLILHGMRERLVLPIPNGNNTVLLQLLPVHSPLHFLPKFKQLHPLSVPFALHIRSWAVLALCSVDS